MQNAQEFLPSENYTSKDQKIPTTEDTESTEEVKIFMFGFLCFSSVLSVSSVVQAYFC